jgi:hypothetical protein
VLNELNSNKIDVCRMQETKFDENVTAIILSSDSHQFEPEKDTCKNELDSM